MIIIDVTKAKARANKTEEVNRTQPFPLGSAP
jgi:hypothetical protein